jgi:hypothetical protein
MHRQTMDNNEAKPTLSEKEKTQIQLDTITKLAEIMFKTCDEVDEGYLEKVVLVFKDGNPLAFTREVYNTLKNKPTS